MAPNVNALGLLLFPKNSTQNAGSKEKDVYEGACSMDAPAGDFGTSRQIGALSPAAATPSKVLAPIHCLYFIVTD